MSIGEGSGSGLSGGDLGWPLPRAIAALHGDAEALIDGERAITYAELATRVGALAAALDELEMPIGGRVGFLGVNSLAHAECVMAVPIAGRVLVDLNFRLTADELSFIASDCGIEVLIVDAEHLEVARALRASCPDVRHLVLDGPTACAEDCVLYERLLDRAPVEPGAVDEHTLAAISYTGGTTGTPKGVMLSHGNLLANARHNLLATGHTGADRWLHVCPMYHVAGTANIFACTGVASRQIILPRFAAGSVLKTIRREAITHTVLVPTMLGMLLEQLDREPSAPALDSLRHIQYAASPIAPELQRRVLERFDCDVAQFYGMTEAAPTVTHLAAADHRRGLAGEEPYATRLQSIGAPVVGVQVEVRGLDDTRLEAGEVGELVVRGPNVMLGYWNRPDVTTSALRGGWYRTGDAARADRDGYLYLVDRLRDMIITGGESVYSIEVEAALSTHSAVSEAAVFGIPDDRWGEAVHAVVTVTPGTTVTAKELVAHCRSHIAGYKVPRGIDLQTDALPRSAAGKLLKSRLREPYWSGRERRVS
jgi:long-chain acyl-CoA synthetase